MSEASNTDVVVDTRAWRVVRDYVSLTKPEVVAFLLLSTCCPLVLAPQGSVSMEVILWTIVGGGLVFGSANAINCIYDRDIDRVMIRTQNRPMAAGRIAVPAALTFAIVLGVAGVLLLALRLNLLSAGIALFGHLFYVVVYTMWLKRRTPQNIVIGGVAGAVPPLVGWAAATGALDSSAFYLFFTIFLWTPLHFWALALNKNDDYRRVGVPMLPVVAGPQVTHRQMLWYALALIPCGILLVSSHPLLGIFSIAALTALGIVFSFKVYQLQSLTGADHEAKAWDVFKFSILYLALGSACIVIDVTLV